MLYPVGDKAKRASGKGLRDLRTESDPIQANQEREDTGGHESEGLGHRPVDFEEGMTGRCMEQTLSVVYEAQVRTKF